MSTYSMFPASIGTGTASLNITAYTTTGGMPASADEGALAIIAATAMNDIFVSADEPAAPVTGDVWVMTGSDSLAPITFTDEVTLYPRAVYKYYETTWVLLKSYVYTSGAWVEVTLSIYDEGSDLLEVLLQQDLGSNYSGVTFTKNASNISWSAAGTAQNSRYMYTDGTVDLTNVDAIKIEHFTYFRSNVKRMVIAPTKSTAVTAAVLLVDSVDRQIDSLDVSALNGSYYIGFEFGNGNYIASYGTVYRMWIERS